MKSEADNNQSDTNRSEPRISPQRLRTLYVMQILLRYSDENKIQITLTELSGTRTFKNMTYAEPTEWNPTDADPGMYYYPIAGSRDALLYVYYTELPCSLDDSLNDTYKDFVNGSFNKDQDTILEERPMEISGFKAYYARGISHTSDEYNLDLEMFIVHDGTYIYGFLFGEKNSLSEEFRAYSKPIIDSIVITPFLFN